MTVHVVVTQEDIDRGRRHDGARCPVARAVRRATGRRTVFVDQYNIDIGDDTRTTPARVSALIEEYDAHGPRVMRPFTFDLPAPRRLR